MVLPDRKVENSIGGSPIPSRFPFRAGHSKKTIAFAITLFFRTRMNQYQ